MIAISMVHHQRSDLRALVTGSAREPGRYQVTWADDLGPSGHTCRDTPEDAVRCAVEDGYRLETAEPASALEMVTRVQSEHAARAAEIEAWLRGGEGAL